MANLMAILVQYLIAKAGLCTGRSLPELCRERFGRRANVMFWLQAEAVAMATDMAEFTVAAVRRPGRAQPRQQFVHHLGPGLRGRAVFTSGCQRWAAIMGHDLRRRGRQRPRLATGPGGAG